MSTILLILFVIYTAISIFGTQHHYNRRLLKYSIIVLDCYFYQSIGLYIASFSGNLWYGLLLMSVAIAMKMFAVWFILTICGEKEKRYAIYNRDENEITALVLLGGISLAMATITIFLYIIGLDYIFLQL